MAGEIRGGGGEGFGWGKTQRVKLVNLVCPNENRDLKIRRRRRQRERHKSNRFLYISLPSLHDYDVKMPNFPMYRGSTQATTKFPLSF